MVTRGVIFLFYNPSIYDKRCLFLCLIEYFLLVWLYSKPLPNLVATLIQISNLSKSYFQQELFAKANVVISEKQKIGVIGRNGAGKSTLLKMIVGDEVPDSGEIDIHNITRLGYLEQHDTVDASQSVLAYLVAMTGKEEWQCAKVAGKFELKSEMLAAPLSTLSGGYQMRVKLAAMLLKEPNLFLLDEPTNYLDVHTQLLLEKFLQTYAGAFLIVSHDREFLRRTCTETLDVEHGSLFLYPGNVEEYLEYKEEQILMKERYNKKIDREQKHLQAFVDRFRYKASKASQAQSKLKAISRLKKIDIANPLKNVRITIPRVEDKKGLAFRAQGLVLGYADRVVAADVNLEIERGEHVAILGDNGQGKTTFLKTITGALAPVAGNFKWSHGATIAYYAQHVPKELPSRETAWGYLRSRTSLALPDEIVLEMAGNFLFNKVALEKTISVLSGGERARLCLAQLLLSGKNVLLLDEPTNHLDFETVEALGQALQEFNGTVIFISHNRTFVNSIATTIIEVKDGAVRRYADTYENYIYYLEQKIAKEEPAQPTLKQELSPDAKKLAHEEDRKRKKLLRSIEKKIESAEKERDSLLKRQAKNPAAFTAGEYEKLGDVIKELHKLEEEWLSEQA